ncbi:MAG: YidC/Oxa1 family membrane protein insertase, partial [Oscillospiraceae bacterium]|nr:YidC/Oxa1 family membrane protein insertase [Oscillospiraceae bacterium]
MGNFYTAIYDVLGVVFGPIMRTIYHWVDNYGVAIIIFTIFCRLLMLPSSISQQKNQAKNARMQIKMRKIQEKYKDDKQRLNEETQEFYRREGYNPMSAGCSGGMLLQFPIIFGLISAIYRPLKYALQLKDDTLKLLTNQTQKLLDAAQPLLDQIKAAEKAKEVLPKLSDAQQHLVDFANALGTGGTKSTYLQLRIVEHIAEYENKIPADLFKTIHDFATNQFTFLGLDLGATPNERKGIYYLIPVLAGLASMATSLYTFFRQR